MRPKRNRILKIILLISNYYPLFLSTSKGELRKTSRILLNPIPKTKREMPGRKIKNGTSEDVKVSSNTNTANSKLLSSAKRIPKRLPKIPRNKYSRAVIVNICLFFAPRVRSKTLSFMRWYLLVRTEPIKTIIPVRMLKNAIKFIIHETLFRISSTTVNICRKSITDTLGNLLTKFLCNLAELPSVGA